jgi:hypothetical protein
MFTMDTMLSWVYGAGPVTADDARDRILAAAGPAVRHLGPTARAAVDWLAGQDGAIVDGVVELLGMATALAPEPVTRARARSPLPLPRRYPTDTVGNSGP